MNRANIKRHLAMQDDVRTLRKLGIPQISTPQMKREILHRIRSARRWCQCHWGALCNAVLTSRAKLQLYKLLVRPILTYGCEVWPRGRKNLKKLAQFESAVLIEIYKSKYHPKDPKRFRIKKSMVYARYKSTDIVTHIEEERMKWNELLKYEETALRGPKPGKKKVTFKKPFAMPFAKKFSPRSENPNSSYGDRTQPYYIAKLAGNDDLRINEVPNNPG